MEHGDAEAAGEDGVHFVHRVAMGGKAGSHGIDVAGGAISPPQEKSNAVAGLVNFMRNIGSGVGTSVVTTMLAQRAQVHQTMMASHTSLDNPNFRDAVNGLALQLSHSGMAMADAQNQAYARMYGLVLNRSSAIAYIDCTD